MSKLNNGIQGSRIRADYKHLQPLFTKHPRESNYVLPDEFFLTEGLLPKDASGYIVENFTLIFEIIPLYFICSSIKLFAKKPRNLRLKSEYKSSIPWTEICFQRKNTA